MGGREVGVLLRRYPSSYHQRIHGRACSLQRTLGVIQPGWPVLIKAAWICPSWHAVRHAVKHQGGSSVTQGRENLSLLSTPATDRSEGMAGTGAILRHECHLQSYITFQC